MLKNTYYTEPTEVDQRVFAMLVPSDHYLRQVKQFIDFERFRDLVKDCYRAAMCRTAEDPVRLIKLEFWQFHYNLSDREVIAEVQVHVACRFFLELSLESRVPVPSLLLQFRTRWRSARHQGLFDQVVTQAREHGLMHDRLRLKDATHMVADIALPTTLQLVARSRQRLLESARSSWPEQVAQEETAAQRLRWVTADRKDVWRVRRQYLLIGMVVTIKRMVKLLSPQWAQTVPQPM